MLRTLTLAAAFSASTIASAIKRADAPVWQPVAGSPWQIVINNNVSVDPFGSSGIVPSSPGIWDIDLFNTPKEVFDELHAKGKKVICYFSAGTGEDWRPDYAQFSPADLGNKLGCWPGEKYLNIKSDGVWKIMQARIKLAADKGCDGLDPDNMDVYANSNGFGISQADSVAFMKKMAAEGRKYGMSIGLKNALEILPSLLNEVQFAVNEECQGGGDCGEYSKLLSAGKPVFHIEYVTHTTSASGQLVLKSELPGLTRANTETIRSVLCLEKSTSDVAQSPATVAPVERDVLDGGDALASKYSTVIKGLLLDGWVYYCDGTSITTPEFNVNTGGPSDGYCGKARRARIQKAKLNGQTSA